MFDTPERGGSLEVIVRLPGEWPSIWYYHMVAAGRVQQERVDSARGAHVMCRVWPGECEQTRV